MGHITLPRGGQLSLILFCHRKITAVKFCNNYIWLRTVVHRCLDLTRTVSYIDTSPSTAQESATSPRSVKHHHVGP